MPAFDANELLDVVAAVESPIIVVATDEYGATLKLWVDHASKAGILPSVVALVGPKTVVPEPARTVQFTAVKDTVIRHRTEAFVTLLNAGISFTHSDADAFWQKDAKEDLATYSEDLVYSQGTIHPLAAWKTWGFVACCGLFRAKPTALNFLRAVLPAVHMSDQEPTNMQLIQRGIHWQAPGDPEHTAVVRSCMVKCWRKPLRGVCPDGLSVAILPMREYQRIPVPGADAAAKIIHHLRLP